MRIEATEEAEPTCLADSQQEAWEILHAAGDAVARTVPFENDDVPQYLENLRGFEEASSKVEILISD